MFLLIPLFLVAQSATPTSDSRWDYPDVLIEDTLGPGVAFAADYNYTTGDIYVACLVDSGYYFDDYCGVLILRSQDHGLSWQKLNSANVLSSWDMENIDLVVTRADTLYIAINDSKKDGTQENIEYWKFYEGGSQYLDHEAATGTANFLSPVLVRDDLNPFYLYRAYIIDHDGDPDSIRLERSTDKGESWDSLYYAYATNYYDCDLTVSDSTVYLTYSFDQLQKKIRTRVFRDRGEIASSLADIQQTSDTINADIEYPRIGATTTQPDNGQLVYTLFSQRNAGTESRDLLYKYSVDGGDNWSSDIDTIIQGSTGGVHSDIRGYEVAPNQWMDMTYCFTTSSPTPSFENFWCWSVEGEPTTWNQITSVSTGIINSIPELIYSPGAPGGGGAVIFNDSLGNLWFDAPWYSGIAENSKENEDKTRSEVVLPGSVVKLNSGGAAVYDVTGREITRLTGDSWDLKDIQGEKVNCGIYFIVNENTGEKVKVLIPIK